jgi:hypothetical protein
MCGFDGGDLSGSFRLDLPIALDDANGFLDQRPGVVD